MPKDNNFKLHMMVYVSDLHMLVYVSDLLL